MFLLQVVQRYRVDERFVQHRKAFSARFLLRCDRQMHDRAVRPHFVAALVDLRYAIAATLSLPSPPAGVVLDRCVLIDWVS